MEWRGCYFQRGEEAMTVKEQLEEQIEEAQLRLREIEAEEQLKCFRVVIKAEVRWVDHIKAETREEAEEIARGKFDLPQSEIGDGSDIDLVGITSLAMSELSRLRCPNCSTIMDPEGDEGHTRYRCCRNTYNEKLERVGIG
jgi:hypothetical protein